ncbi:adenylate/guanylate cyclase domain-containing protein [Maribacter sp. MAR_2009_72]|uniref:adenylate/guanylate cyclase domain-containing protein n=1 Tax=Maribacter sp. MAR_2009_72 TaxID=1250050 RepID=UPI001199DB8E|nr:adenylate/guanylate cyclase domain-containing protein [Maribacter sp. MAR_2009_72]TVZ14657.1 class 3 adenylate cyclase [Maribacter sp. MAR_2009_72]
MSSTTHTESAQKEIDYYKERLKKLTSSYMSLEYRNAALAKDVLEMSEGLKVISSLQYKKDSGLKLEELLDFLTENINVRLKMDVTLLLIPENEMNQSFKPKFIKAFNSYNKEAILKKSVSFNTDFVESKSYIISDDNENYKDFISKIRQVLEIDHFILSPIINTEEIIGYIFTGRRSQLLQTGTGLVSYHHNILEAISSVISALRSQIDRNKILEKKVAKRTAELRKEKEVSEKLLLNILPYETTLELKKNGFAKAKDYSVVTVLFTDFVNFTSFSEGLESQELVAEIDFYYSAFDNIISKYEIEKIKTIGDSYMCAAGLPVKNFTHAIDAINTALDIRDFVEKTKLERIKENKHYFDIRIGLNSGPVIAGIVGIKKFAYDIWGDTVNIASRMESSCEPGKINISKSTYDLVWKDFDCTHRGAINVKNKGVIDMYFVERLS